jgi:hypothetical protein
MFEEDVAKEKVANITQDSHNRKVTRHKTSLSFLFSLNQN